MPARLRNTRNPQADLYPAGTPVWLASAGMVIAGRVYCTAGPNARNVHLCSVGQYHPRICQVADLNEITGGNVGPLGLCPHCLGFGTIGESPAPRSATAADWCPACCGSGRAAMRLIRHTVAPGRTPVTAVIVPHGIRRATVPGVSFDVCVACGLPAADRGAHPGIVELAGLQPDPLHGVVSPFVHCPDVGEHHRGIR